MSDKNTNFENIVKVLALFAGCLLFININYSLYIYYSLMNSKGLTGPKGVEGLVGKKGNPGICTSTCGQKVCSKLVLENMNNYIVSKGGNNLTNKFIINKINKICNSDKYTGFLHSNHPNKPTEKQLIEYIKDNTKTWIDKILEHEKGNQFLRTSEYTDTYFEGDSNPFEEIIKFEIWDWGDPYRFKPIVRRQCGVSEHLPKIDAELDIIFTNNYEVVFDNKGINTVYGPDNCPFNQLGTKRNNPRNISKCIYDNNSNIESKEVYKMIETTDYSKDISFYNVNPTYLEELNKSDKKYYQLGTVWRGTNDTKRNSFSNEIGPSKETIIVCDNGEKQDNLKPPINFEKIWSNKDLDNTNFDVNDIDMPNITIWRPNPPEGYVSLGDFVTNGVDLSQSLNISKVNFRCIKKELLEDIVFSVDNSKVWDNSGFEITYRPSNSSKAVETESENENENEDQIQKIKQIKTVSIWPSGITDKDDEIQHLGHKLITPIKIGGYNYFRASDSNNLPKLTDSWIIKPISYTVQNTEDPKAPNNDYGIGWLGGKMRENKYSTFKKKVTLGFTPKGIIQPLEPDGGKETKYFIEYDDELNFYFILRYGKKGDFEYLRQINTTNNEQNIDWISNTKFEQNTNKIKQIRDYWWNINVLSSIPTPSISNITTPQPISTTPTPNTTITNGNINEDNINDNSGSDFFEITIQPHNESPNTNYYLHKNNLNLDKFKWKLLPSTNFQQ